MVKTKVKPRLPIWRNLFYKEVIEVYLKQLSSFLGELLNFIGIGNRAIVTAQLNLNWSWCLT